MRAAFADFWFSAEKSITDKAFFAFAPFCTVFTNGHFVAARAGIKLDAVISVAVESVDALAQRIAGD